MRHISVSPNPWPASSLRLPGAPQPISSLFFPAPFWSAGFRTALPLLRPTRLLASAFASQRHPAPACAGQPRACVFRTAHSFAGRTGPRDLLSACSFFAAPRLARPAAVAGQPLHVPTFKLFNLPTPRTGHSCRNFKCSIPFRIKLLCKTGGCVVPTFPQAHLLPGSALPVPGLAHPCFSVAVAALLGALCSDMLRSVSKPPASAQTLPCI